jgi:hypothetical protein
MPTRERACHRGRRENAGGYPGSRQIFWEAQFTPRNQEHGVTF